MKEVNVNISERIDDKIIRISGAKPCQCSCEKCRSLCHTPCLGTPDDIEKLIQAGYGDRLEVTHWGVGILAGVTDKVIGMLQPRLEPNGWCTFRRADGLCELHDKDLKPLEGKLASCAPRPVGWSIHKDFTWLIAQTWLPLQGQFKNS